MPSPSSRPSAAANNQASAPDAPELYPALDAQGVSPLDLLRTLWNGKWLILGLALLFAGSSYVYWDRQPKQYRASSILLLKEPQQFDQLSVSLPTKNSDRTGRDLYFLRNSAVFARTVASRLADSMETTDAAGAPPLSASALRRRVRVVRGSREVPAIKISVTGTDPEAAALITNTYATTYRDHLRASSNARLRSSRQFLESQKRRLKGRLRAIEDSIAAYVRRQGQGGLLGASDSSAGGIVGEARQIAGEISELRLQKEELQLKLDIERRMLDSTKARLRRIRPNLAERASSTTADRLRRTQQKIASLQARIERITRRNDTLKPALRTDLERMRSRVDALQDQSRRLADRYVRQALSTDGVQPLSGEGGGGLSTVVELQRQLSEHRIAITKLEAQRSALTDRIAARQAALQQPPDQTLARLKRRKQTTEELFITLSKSLQKAQVSSKSTPPQAQILQEATPPAHPLGPDVKRNVLLALFLGATLGGGIVVLYNRVDNRVEAPEDIEELGAGLFGVIPSWSPGGAPPDSDAAPSGLPSRPWSGIAAPCSPAAEAYRHVVTNLQLGVPQCLDRLLVTSPYPKEGKSTTTANLGVTLSEAGLDVLLVDTDAYGATLHRAFGVDRRPGLTDRLAGERPPVRELFAPSEDLFSVSGDGAPGESSSEAPSVDAAPCGQMGRLGLLPVGAEVPQPSLLLQESLLQSLFEELQNEWDLLLLDSAPILSYDATSRLAALSDMVLLVGNAGETKTEGYEEALDRAHALCPGPAAGVLNRHDASRATVYGYGYEHSTSPSVPSDASPAERLVERTRRGFRHLATGS